MRSIFLFAANKILDILEKISTKSQISNCKEIHPVRAALMQTGRRTDGHDEINRLVSSLRKHA